MSPLQTGPSSIRKNMTELMRPIQSQARKKAVVTISKRNNISKQQAQFNQALAISKSQARKT